jgi:D-threo-aldose 1-dehydrogenase
MALNEILPSKLGFGTAPLGNMFRAIPEAEALATVEAAWGDGVRYYDTAPLYGAGLAELRLGSALSGKPRREYVLSTKVGRVVLDETVDVRARDLGEKGEVFKHGRANKIVNDYSEDATHRSLEDSLKRLKTDYVDIAWVHDVAQDFYGDEWLGKFEEARKGWPPHSLRPPQQARRRPRSATPTFRTARIRSSHRSEPSPARRRSCAPRACL